MIELKNIVGGKEIRCKYSLVIDIDWYDNYHSNSIHENTDYLLILEVSPGFQVNRLCIVQPYSHYCKNRIESSFWCYVVQTFPLMLFYIHALLFWVPLTFRYWHIGETTDKFATFREVQLPVLSSYFACKHFLLLNSVETCTLSCRSCKPDDKSLVMILILLNNLVWLF